VQPPPAGPAPAEPPTLPDHANRSKTPDLIRMANQIAANFAHHPADQAAHEVATHLRTFWSPAMWSDLLGWNERSDESANDLNPLVVAALGLLASDD
jgi:formate dehydrogenase subunit delta